MAGAGGDERQRGEFGEGDGAASGQRVTVGDGQPDRFVEERCAVQALAVDGLRGDAQVDLVGAEPAGHQVGRKLPQFDLGGRVGALVRGQWRGEGEEGLGGQPDRPEAVARRLGDGPAAGFQFAEGALRVAAEQPAGLVQAEPAAAVEQRGAEFLLQAGDGAAQRGLGDPEFLGGAAEVFEPRHHQELAKRVQVHGRPPVPSPPVHDGSVITP